MKTFGPRGHEVKYDRLQERWVYADMLEPYAPSQKQTSADRPCVLCGKSPTDDGHDACVANLPDVRACCCGHGVGEPYVAFRDGSVLRGAAAHCALHKLGGRPPWEITSA